MATTRQFVGINDNFRGKTLSSWMAEWLQWMHSSSVSYGGRNGEIVFTRGNLSYEYKVVGGPRIQIDPDKPYREEVFITNYVPVYVNIRTSFYFIGEPHPFGTLNTLTDVLAACRDDHSRGGIKSKDIVQLTNPNNIDDPANKRSPLPDTYVEAFGINVKVDPHSELADQFEFPVQRNADLNGCAVGDICLIPNLPNGDYAIVTANTGARAYQSSSEYTIHVGANKVRRAY